MVFLFASLLRLDLMNAAILTNPSLECPPEIIQELVQLPVHYWNFTDQVCHGTIEVHRDVASDVAGFFDLAYETHFPIERVVRASDEPYKWDDDKLMAANTSSGFNYRTIAGSTILSHHSRGLAFDINTRLNPYIRYTEGREIIAPDGAVWEPGAPGVLSKEHPLVQFMIKRGWIWGGDWTFENNGMIDYQHFQKDLK
jgi:peptidoglycan L-alanyl-D-glutamate endopeptidase CwlK